VKQAKFHLKTLIVLVKPNQTPAVLIMQTINCALSFYCVCFSIIKTCNYWKTDTLDFISEHGKIIYSQNLANLTTNNFPKIIYIYNAEKHVTFKTEQHGNLWYNSHNGRLELENMQILFFEFYYISYLLFHGINYQHSLG